MGTSRCPTRGAANDAMPGPSNVLVDSGNMPVACQVCQPPATAGRMAEVYGADAGIATE